MQKVTVIAQPLDNRFQMGSQIISFNLVPWQLTIDGQNTFSALQHSLLVSSLSLPRSY